MDPQNPKFSEDTKEIANVLKIRCSNVPQIEAKQPMDFRTLNLKESDLEGFLDVQILGFACSMLGKTQHIIPNGGERW